MRRRNPPGNPGTRGTARGGLGQELAPGVFHNPRGPGMVYLPGRDSSRPPRVPRSPERSRRPPPQPSPTSEAHSPVIQALLGKPPAAAASGPYQGAAGSEAQNPGQQRTPPPDWADPNSPNYERRNYYIGPDGVTVAREPGYYNPDNPFDTGRPNEKQGEFRGMWDPSMERRMDEPGVTPWGPGGKSSPAGPFAAPAGGAQHPSLPPRRPLPEHPALTPDIREGLFPGQIGQELPAELIAFLEALLGPSKQASAMPRRPNAGYE